MARFISDNITDKHFFLVGCQSLRNAALALAYLPASSAMDAGNEGVPSVIRFSATGIYYESLLSFQVMQT